MMTPTLRYRRIKVRSWNRATRAPDADGPWWRRSLECRICGHRVELVHPAWAGIRGLECTNCACEAWEPAGA